MFEEIAGSSARYVDPMDVAGWGRAIEEAIDDRAATAAPRPAAGSDAVFLAL